MHWGAEAQGFNLITIGLLNESESETSTVVAVMLNASAQTSTFSVLGMQTGFFATHIPQHHWPHLAIRALFTYGQFGSWHHSVLLITRFVVLYISPAAQLAST